MQRKNKVFLRGVINSDTPKGVSRFVTPLQGVSRFATVPWQYPKNHFCQFYHFCLFCNFGN